MEKIKKFFADFVKTRKVTYYVVLGLAVSAFVMGIVAAAPLSVAGATVLPLVFTLLGLLIFVGLSVIGQEKFGAGAVSLAAFISLAVLICEVFEHYLGVIQDQAMGGFNIFAIEGIVALIVCVAVFLVCSIAANVLSWLKLTKPMSAESAQTEAAKADEDASIAADEKTDVPSETAKEAE